MISGDDFEMAEGHFDELAFKEQQAYLVALGEYSEMRANGEGVSQEVFDTVYGVHIDFPQRKELSDSMLEKLTKKGKKATWKELE